MMNDITHVIEHVILPNLPYFLRQIFLIVLMVIVFAFVNIVVRFITDPLCIKVLRMKENKRGPGTVGFVVSAVIMVFLLIFAYNAFPQLQPTVIGWTGKTLQKVISLDFDSFDKSIPSEVKGVPEKIESGAKKAVKKVKSATKKEPPAPPKAPPAPPKAPPPPPPAPNPPASEPPDPDGHSDK